MDASLPAFVDGVRTKLAVAGNQTLSSGARALRWNGLT